MLPFFYTDMSIPRTMGYSDGVSLGSSHVTEVVGKGQSRPLRNGDEIAVLPAKRQQGMRGVL